MKRFSMLVLLVSGACLFAVPAAAQMSWDSQPPPGTGTRSSGDFDLKFQNVPEPKIWTNREIYDVGERPPLDENQGTPRSNVRSTTPRRERVTPSSTERPERMRRRSVRTPEPRHVKPKPVDRPTTAESVIRESVEDIGQAKTPRKPSGPVAGQTSEPAVSPRPPAVGPHKGPATESVATVPAAGSDSPVVTATKPMKWGATVPAQASPGEVKPAEEKPKFHWGQQN